MICPFLIAACTGFFILSLVKCCIAFLEEKKNKYTMIFVEKLFCPASFHEFYFCLPIYHKVKSSVLHLAVQWSASEAPPYPSKVASQVQ